MSRRTLLVCSVLAPAFASAASLQGTAGDAGAPARLANAVADAPTDSVAVTIPVYLGKITHEFSTDTTGTFNIDFIDPGAVQRTSQTMVADENSTPFAFTADGAVINISELPIPTISEWGLIVLALLLSAGTVIFRRRRSAAALIVFVCVGAALLIAATPHVGSGETQPNPVPGQPKERAPSRAPRDEPGTANQGPTGACCFTPGPVPHCEADSNQMSCEDRSGIYRVTEPIVTVAASAAIRSTPTPRGSPMTS